MSIDGRTKSSDTISARLHSPYREWLAETVEKTGMKQAQIVRLFTMIGLDADMLGLSKRLTEIEKALKRLEAFLHDAVE